MPEQFGDKKHEATQYRRQQAREHGQVVRSQDLASAAVLVGAVSLLIYFGQGLATYLRGYTETQLSSPTLGAIGRGDAAAWMVSPIMDLSRVLLPVLGLILVVAVMSHLGQTGLLFLPEKVNLNWSHISPLKGLQRIFSWANVVRLAFGLVKTMLVLGVAAWCLWTERERVLSAGSLTIPRLATVLIEVLLWTCLKIGAALLVLALLDYLFQYWKHESDLMMTDQEMREEMKTLQGDPQVIARRRAIQRQLVLNRLGSLIPSADFVVTNPTELAVAIKYDMETMPAPIVVAKGAGVLAQRIRRLALEHGVPIVERKELARALYQQVEVNEPIPTEQYAAVAEILKYVYQLKGKTLPRAA